MATPLTQRPAWRALAAHYAKVRDLHLRDLFAADPARGERMSADTGEGRCAERDQDQVAGVRRHAGQDADEDQDEGEDPTR